MYLLNMKVNGKYLFFKLSVLVVLFGSVESKCSRLPSGKCWVTCIEEILNVICNDVTTDMIRKDIKVFSGTAQMLRLYIWNSPTIRRLSSDVFEAVKSQIYYLDLQDVSDLDTFPEIRHLSKLYRMSIWNSPKLSTLSMELLPQSMSFLSLNKVSIKNFVNDFSEVPALPAMQKFVLRNITIEKWQSNFLAVFPNLKQLRIANVTFLADQPSEALSVTPPLNLIKISMTTSNSSGDPNSFFRALLMSLRLSVDGYVDLSYNNVDIIDKTFENINNFYNASQLILRGNTISANAKVPEGLFANFTNLRYLDLGKLSLSSVKGFFRNLPKLSELILDHNDLSKIPSTDIFDGFQWTNLTRLDLSYCNLDALPLQDSFRSAIVNLVYLNLEGNRLKMLERPTEDNSVETFFSGLPKLNNLCLRNNQLSTFYGQHMRSLTALIQLDVSCNHFSNITRTTFENLPGNLLELDLSLCISLPLNPPFIDKDAFLSLPPIKVLKLNSGAYKHWIFSLLKFSNQTVNFIEEIHLDDNAISYMTAETLPNLPQLKKLSLNRNVLQSIAPMTFQRLPQLRSLLLSENQLLFVRRQTFSNSERLQLQNLEILDVSKNSISKIRSGSFDNLPKLKSLMIGWNPVEVQNIFVSGADELIYLGIQDYNASCLRPEFFQGLRKLHYVFLDEYNFIRARPDGSLLKRDDYLLSLVNDCVIGEVLPDHEVYPGLQTFVSVTVHDTDEGQGVQYPVLVAFFPLSYCPVDNYVSELKHMICSSK